MKIDWGKYVDGIHCLHYSEQCNKIPRLRKELARVGILESGIFHMHYTFQSPYDNDIFEKHKEYWRCTSPAMVNICLEVRRILQTALMNGEKKILLLENDVAFLKSFEDIKNLLDEIPKDSDFIQFDTYVHPNVLSVYKEKVIPRKGNYVRFDKDAYTSAACIYLSELGMKEMLRVMTEDVYVTDMTYAEMNCTKYVSKKNLTVQILYEGSFSSSNDPNLMHEVYLNHGVMYEEYNVPENYTEGCTYKETKEEIKMENTNKEQIKMEETKATLDWGKYFDHIFCINFLGNKSRLPGLKGEFDRVGLTSSGILTYANNTPDPWDKVIAKNCPRGAWAEFSNLGFVNLGLSTARVLRASLALGYQRILILEDDIRFLNDIDKMKEIIEASPWEYNIIQYDKFADRSQSPESYREMVDSHKINDYFFKMPFRTDEDFASGACFALDRKAMKAILDKLENVGPRPTDRIFGWVAKEGVSYAIADKNLCVQVVFRDALVFDYLWSTNDERNKEGNTHHQSYRPQGINYKDYAVPHEYDYGVRAALDSGKHDVCVVYCLESKNGSSRFWDMAAYSASSVAKNIDGVEFKVIHRGNVPDSDGTRYLAALCGVKGFIRNDYIDSVCSRNYDCRKEDNYASIIFAKLLIPQLDEFKVYDRVIVMDADAIVIGDMNGIKNIKIPTGIGASRDWCPDHSVRWGGRLPYSPEEYDGMKPGLSGETPFFSSGFIVFDMHNIPGDYNDRLNRILEIDRRRHFSLPEQDCLNCAFDITELPQEYSCYWDTVQKFKDERKIGDPIVLQYTGEKGKKKMESLMHGCKKKIAVYAITKNEEKFVDRWMDSMSEADEVVVLDTGSTDNTVEKLKARGAIVKTKTYSPWRFDIPRNDSIEMVSEDADILVCTDLDEILRPGWRKALEDAWIAAENNGKHPNRASYQYIWDFDSSGKPARVFTYEKVHTRHGWKWVSPIHETLQATDKTIVKESVSVPMVLEHHMDKTKSRGSYLPLLELAIKENPADDRMVHYLAREYMFHDMVDKQIEAAKHHLSMRSSWVSERAVSMRIIAKGYDAKGDGELSELWFRRAFDEDPVQREALYEYATILMGRKDYRRCAKILMEMFERKTKTDIYITEEEAWGWKPYDMLGIALWYSGNKEGSRRVYEIACAKFPDSEQLRSNYDLAKDKAVDAIAKAIV